MTGVHLETPKDLWEVEALLDLCFAPGREALSSYRLRDGVPPVSDLCLVWRDEYGSVGAVIRHWPVRVGGQGALLLGPIAVHPTHQGEGLGSTLMGAASARAVELGWHRVLLVGDASYYGRFGFDRLDGVHMPPPTDPRRVLGKSLSAGAWDGIHGHVTRAVD